MSGKKKSVTISRDEIQRAIAKFKKTGGLIKKLPDEPTPVHSVVGHKWAMYETPLDNSVGSVAP